MLAQTVRVLAKSVMIHALVSAVPNMAYRMSVSAQFANPDERVCNVAHTRSGMNTVSHSLTIMV